MNDIFLNRTTEYKINNILLNLPQSIILNGPDGIGLITIANFIKSQYKGAKSVYYFPQKDDLTDRKNGSITVEQIRNIYKIVKNHNNEKNFIIIVDADKMTIDAQNAILKLYEEPNYNTYFILLSHNIRRIISTVRSRATQIEIGKISHEDSLRIIKYNNIEDRHKIDQLLFIADGLPAKLNLLITNNNIFTHEAAQIKNAGQLMSEKNTYNKLLLINSYSNKRADAVDLMSYAIEILNINYKKNPTLSLANMINRALYSVSLLEQNIGVKLALSYFVL